MSQDGNYPEMSVGYATSAQTATKAEKDGDGNNIAQTYVNKSGDTMTGNLTLKKALLSQDGSNPVYVLPFVPVDDISGPPYASDNYFKELLKWICKNYPNVESATWIGRANPNSAGQCIISIYGTKDVNSEGLPKYSDGFYTSIQADPLWFSTLEYSFNIVSLNDFLKKSGDTMTGELSLSNLKLTNTGYPNIIFQTTDSDKTILLEQESDGILMIIGRTKQDNGGQNRFVLTVPEKTGTLALAEDMFSFSGGSAGSTGYIIFSNGFKIAWGRITPSSGGTNVSYGIAFNFPPTVAGICINATSTNQILALRANSINTIGFTAYGMYSQNTSGLTGGDVTFTWMAMGY